MTVPSPQETCNRIRANPAPNPSQPLVITLDPACQPTPRPSSPSTAADTTTRPSAGLRKRSTDSSPSVESGTSSRSHRQRHRPRTHSPVQPSPPGAHPSPPSNGHDQFAQQEPAVTSLLTYLEDLKSQIASLTSQLDRERATTADQATQLSAARAEHAPLQSALDANAAELTKASSTQAQLGAKLREVEGEKEALEGQVAALAADVEAGRERAYEAEAAMAEQAKRAKQDAAAIAELERRLDEADDKHEAEAEKHVKTFQEKVQLTKEKDELEGEVVRAKAGWAASEDKLRAAEEEGRRLKVTLREKEKKSGEEAKACEGRKAMLRADLEAMMAKHV